MRHRTSVLCLGLLLALPAGSRAEDPALIKMAVMDLQNDAEMKQGIVTTLNEILLAEFSKAGNLEILGSSDITSMLSLEEDRLKLTGCAEDSCLAEIGGALGVALMATARVGAVGDQYVLSVKIIDVKKAKVKSRTSEVTDRDDSVLIKTLKQAVATAMAGAKIDTPEQLAEPHKKAEPASADGSGVASPDPIPTVTAEPETPSEPKTFMDVAPWIGVGLTVVAAGVGGAMGGLAMKDSKAADDELKGTGNFKDLEDSAGTKALVADVMFGVAGAAAVTTVILFVLNAMDGEPAATAAVIPTRGGAAAAVSVSW